MGEASSRRSLASAAPRTQPNRRARSGGCVHLSREAGFRCGDVVRAFSSRLCPQPVHDPTTPPK